jgi:hypothetical protein
MHRIVFLNLVLSFGIDCSLLSAEVVPDLTKGGKPDKKHDWNLGPTGARGWMWGRSLETTHARQILITKVDKGSPADGKSSRET